MSPLVNSGVFALGYTLLPIFFLVIILAVIKPNPFNAFSIIDGLLLVLLAWITVNKFVLYQNRATSLEYYEWISLLGLYAIVRCVPVKWQAMLLLAICVSGAIQSIYGNLQLWGVHYSNHGLFKMTGSFFNPGPYAGFLCMVLPVALGVYWKFTPIESFRLFLKGIISTGLKSFKFQVSSLRLGAAELKCKQSAEWIKKLFVYGVRLIAGITIIVIILVLPAARSRAAWLGAIAGVGYLAWYRYRVWERMKQLIANSNYGSNKGLNVRVFECLSVEDGDGASVGQLFNDVETQNNQTIKQAKRSNIQILKASNKRSAKTPKASNTQTSEAIKHSNKMYIWQKLLIPLIFILIIGSGIGIYLFKKDSADGRLFIWKNTWEIIKDHPVTGVGQGMFPAYYMLYQAEHFKQNTDSPFERVAGDNKYVFNEPLKMWVENGVVGFVLMLVLLFLLFRRRVTQSFTENYTESHREEKISHLVILRGAILAIFVFGLFGYPSEIKEIKVVVVCCVGIFTGCLNVRVFECLNVE